MAFDPKLGVHCSTDLHFTYDEDVFGPEPEFRRLDAIRPSLRNPNCKGPDPVYSIVMDVGRKVDLDQLKSRMVLFGVVAYASGRLGDEPVRSQGHIHAIAPNCGWSTPELFEIWEGRAIIYAQERATDDPGRCFAVTANPGDKVVVPPEWAHCVINADPELRLIFGAWCNRHYGFVYNQIRARGGLAWFPVLDGRQNICWEPNPRYRKSEISVRAARMYPELGLIDEEPIYEEFVTDPDSIQWISQPARVEEVWCDFEP